MKPQIIKGGISVDNRGKIFHNNNFDLSLIKRIYLVENINVDYLRGWKGHLVEKRWFFCSYGIVEVHVTNIDCFKRRKPKIFKFELSDENLNVLYVPEGFATLIKQKKPKSRVVAMSDYLLNTSNDENLRWNIDYFKYENCYNRT